MRLSRGPPWPNEKNYILKRGKQIQWEQTQKQQTPSLVYLFYFPKRLENIKAAFGVLCNLAVTWPQTMSMSRKTLKDPCRLNWSLEVHECKSPKRTQSTKPCDDGSGRKTTIWATSEIRPHQIETAMDPHLKYRAK